MKILTRISRDASVCATALCLGLGCFTIANGQNFPLPPPTPFPGIEDPIPAPMPTSPVTVGLSTIVTGLVSPVTGTFAPGHPNDLFIVDQTGQNYDTLIFGTSLLLLWRDTFLLDGLGARGGNRENGDKTAFRSLLPLLSPVKTSAMTAEGERHRDPDGIRVRRETYHSTKGEATSPKISVS